MKEVDIIAALRRAFTRQAPGLVQGIGDDCAVLRLGGRNWLVTTDSLVEEVHFRADTISPYRLGRKSLAVNLSDIAAMGGLPRYAFLNLGLPRPIPKGFLSSFMRGLRAEAVTFGVALAGGDTHASPGGIAVGLTVIGECGPRPAYRSAAKPGDLLYVSGFLGQAAAGMMLQTGRGSLPKRIIAPHRRELIDAHQLPQPQVALGRLLVAGGWVGAMIDLSDGLASDLRHICRASGVGAVIDADRVPLSPALRQAANLLAEDPLELALRGGEDYQLLFTVPPRSKKKAEDRVARRLGRKIFPIGEIISSKRVLIKSAGRLTPLRIRGFDHFAR